MTTCTFASDDAVAEIAEGVIARTLPKSRWTHAAHVAAAVWLVARRPDLDPERDMPGLIRAYNEATGVRNTDTEGYHETITQASLRAVRAGLARLPADTPAHVAVEALLADGLGRSDWLLAYWSKPALFSVEARRRWVEPDLAPLPF